jgi:hypothetical protein
MARDGVAELPQTTVDSRKTAESELEKSKLNEIDATEADLPSRIAFAEHAHTHQKGAHSRTKRYVLQCFCQSFNRKRIGERRHPRVNP